MPIFVSVLVFTIVVEVFVAFCLGFRSKLELTTVALVNLITNPILNVIEYIGVSLKLLPLNIYIVLFLEMIVVLVEWALLRFTLRQGSKRLFYLSFLMNTASYGGGVLFFRYIL